MRNVRSDSTDLGKSEKAEKINKMKTTKIITRTLHLHRQSLAKIVPNNLKGRSKSSQEWLTRQLTDPFVERAKMMNYRYVINHFNVYYVRISTKPKFLSKLETVAGVLSN